MADDALDGRTGKPGGVMAECEFHRSRFNRSFSSVDVP
jgi:hypothetical protein